MRQFRTFRLRPVASPCWASYLGVCVGGADRCRSALKHGLKEQDILHAYRHPIRIWDLGDGSTMTVGATATASILEVGSIQGETAVVIVHAMRAREKFLR